MPRRRVRHLRRLLPAAHGRADPCDGRGGRRHGVRGRPHRGRRGVLRLPAPRAADQCARARRARTRRAAALNPARLPHPVPPVTKPCVASCKMMTRRGGSEPRGQGWSGEPAQENGALHRGSHRGDAGRVRHVRVLQHVREVRRDRSAGGARAHVGRARLRRDTHVPPGARRGGLGAVGRHVRFREDARSCLCSGQPYYDALDNLDIDVIAYFDRSRAPIYTAVLERSPGRLRPLSAEGSSRLRNARGLLDARKPGVVCTGVVSLPEGTLLVASAPITTSDLSGAPSGNLVFGRFLAGFELAVVGRVTGLDVTAYSTSGHLPADVSNAATVIGREKPAPVTPLGSGALAAYAMVSDLDGAPAAILRAVSDRPVNDVGRRTESNSCCSGCSPRVSWKPRGSGCTWTGRSSGGCPSSARRSRPSDPTRPGPSRSSAATR